MKKLWSMILAMVLVVSLTACGSGETAKEVVPIPETQADLAETDTLELIFPEGDLATLGTFSYLADNMCMFFTEYYPDVKLEIQYVPAAEYGTVVATAMMAGSGPDIIFPQQMKDSDIYKIMDIGALLNLDEIIAQDEQFQAEDYLDGVLEGTRYKGGLYMMPLSIKTAYLTGSQEQNQQSGLAEDGMDNIFRLLEEATRMTAVRKESGDTGYHGMIDGFVWQDDREYRGTDWETELLPETTLFFDIDIPLVNYETKEIVVDEELLRRWAEAMMAYGEASDYTKDSRGYGMENVYRGYGTMEYQNFYRYYYLFDSQFGAAGQGETPWLQALPGISGEKVSHISTCLAINANGKNQLNAWRLIKLMLSYFAQGSMYGSDSMDGYPILKEAYTKPDSCIQTDIKAEWAELNSSGSSVKYGPLSDEQFDAVITELLHPGKVLPADSGPVQEIFRETMLPYFDGEQELDQCITALKDKLRIYVSE